MSRRGRAETAFPPGFDFPRREIDQELDPLTQFLDRLSSVPRNDDDDEYYYDYDYNYDYERDQYLTNYLSGLDDIDDDYETDDQYEIDHDDDDDDYDYDDEEYDTDNDDDYALHDREDDLYKHGIFRIYDPIPHQEPEHLTVDQVRARADPMNKRIWENYTHLQAITQRYEAVIQRRWEKKSKIKRRDAVINAWGPDSALPRNHRPELLHIRSRPPHTCREDCQDGFPKKFIFFFPYLNLEDLCKTEPLLLLLNARGRNPPSVFAHTDLEHAHRGLKVTEVPYPPVLKDWTMRFLGRDTLETYGELISEEQDPEARSRLLRSRDVSPGEGLWILEIQDRLYQFLVNACRGILHDTDLTIAAISNVSEAPEPTVPTANRKGDALASSLMTLRYESTYCVPSKINLSRLQDIVAAKLAVVEDTIWALREDPAFFIDMLDEWYCHRSELTPDIYGNQHPCLVKESHRAAFTARIVGAILSYYLPALEIWGRLYDKIVDLAKIKNKLFDCADPPVQVDDDLPYELELAFQSLLYHLEEEAEPNLQMIINRAKWSPPMSYLFRRKPPRSVEEAIHGTLSGEGQVSMVGSGAVPKTGMHGIETEYLFILHAIADPGGRETFGLDTCIEEIDRIIQHPVGKKLVTSHMQEMFSDIFIFAEGIRQVELFRPWADTFESRLVKHETLYDEVVGEWKDTFKMLTTLANFFPTQRTCNVGAELLHMKYPVEKKRTKANVEAMQAAETKLDTFWVQVLAQLQKAGLMKGRLGKVFDRPDPERTPDWVELPKKQPKKVAVQPLADIPVNIAPDARTSKIQPIQPKTKTKTRGVARPSPTATSPAADGDEESQPTASPEQTFRVDKRALKVFSMLYFQPSAESQPGEIPWLDFLYAMNQVGFGSEKLGGSAWQFTPGPSLDTCTYVRGIQFHEPHPIAKIPFRMARMYGRRLARTYGWGGQTFRASD